MEEQQPSKKPIIIGAITLLLVIALALGFFLLKGSKGSGTGTTSFGAMFGSSGADTPRPTSPRVTGADSTGGSDTTNTTGATEPLFRQLSTIEVAGATVIEKDRKPLVRYIARENGFVYDVDPKTGASTQLTNTTIPRIYEAFWAKNGSVVVMRYLKYDDVSRKDTIKTQIAELVLPTTGESSSTDMFGSLSVSDSQLPDNISALSVSADGQKLFYLLPVVDGISGTIVNIDTKAATEIFRNSFSEWIPQLLDSGDVILTTKASVNVPGYAYLYHATTKTLARMVREKNGLTTLATPRANRMLYSENLMGNTILSLYDTKGFVQDEGGVTHTAPLQLATLPEKCAWSKNGVRVYCGAFASTPQAQIPDDWYQGVLSFNDTFWTIDTDLADLVFLADPKKEIGKTFDVIEPFVDKTEDHFFFINKNDSTLWSMRLERSKFTTSADLQMDSSSSLPELTPDEMKDALGSVATTAPKSKKK
jgi:hypothetical protein